jgi:hypothetical protein
VLLANPRWERRLAMFLELSGVGKVMADGTDDDGAYAARMDEWVALEAVGGTAQRGEGKSLYSISRGDDCGCGVRLFCFTFSCYFLLLGGLAPRDLRTAHCRGRRIPFLCRGRPTEGRLQVSFPLSFLGRISLRDGWRCHEK